MVVENKNPSRLQRRITRREAIKAGGIAALGLAFSKPIIETIHPKPIFATNGTGMPCATKIQLDNPEAQVTANDFLEAVNTVVELWTKQMGLVCAGSCPPGEQCLSGSIHHGLDCVDQGNNIWNCAADSIVGECRCVRIA